MTFIIFIIFIFYFAYYSCGQTFFTNTNIFQPITIWFVFVTQGVYISRISENGPADLDKRLQVGDKILSVSTFFYNFCEAQRSHFVVISVKIKERTKIFPIPWCLFTLFKNNVNFDPILRQPKNFLRNPKSSDKRILCQNSRR